MPKKCSRIFHYIKRCDLRSSFSNTKNRELWLQILNPRKQLRCCAYLVTCVQQTVDSAHSSLTMPRQSTQFDFGDSKKPITNFALYENIIEDRRSVYSVSIGHVGSHVHIESFLKQLKSNKTYATATHNSWAARITHDGVLFETKRDDNETGAGMVILRVMQKENVTDCMICVTRWFGGVKLMGDRFKHLQTATRYAIEQTELSHSTDAC